MIVIEGTKGALTVTSADLINGVWVGVRGARDGVLLTAEQLDRLMQALMAAVPGAAS